MRFISIVSAVLLAAFWMARPALCVSANDTKELDVADEAACAGTSTELRHWATLELRGVPVFLHQRLDRKGHFLIEPLVSLPDKAETLNASCVRFDRLTRQHYVSFPVTLQDDEALYQAKEQLRHVAPRSVAFMRLASAELLSERLPGGWTVEKFRVSLDGRLGYLRINCPSHQKCVDLRTQLMRHQVGIFERVLLRIGAASQDGCVALGNLTKQVVVPHASQLDVAGFARPKVPQNCTQSLKFFREFYVSGYPMFVMQEAAAIGGSFWLEPLLTFDGGAVPFRNASGWPGLSLRLSLREPAARNAVAGRLRLLGNGPLRFLHLVDYRLTRSGLAGVGIDRLRLSMDRASAHLRLMAPNETAAGAEAIAELRRRISANPTLLFDALRFNFSFSADDACQAAYWAERRVAIPQRTQYRVPELHQRASRPSCRLARQPQVEKVALHGGLPVVLWRRLDRPLTAGRHFLVEPLMLYEDRLGLEFDYSRGAHFVGLNVTVQSSLVAEQILRNLTYLPARSVAFMLIRELSLKLTVNMSGVRSVEFYLSYDQRNGFLRLYCESMAACAGLKNYLKSSELLLERLHMNITMATPDDGCTAPEPIPKLIAAGSHLFDLAYLREKSPSRLDCADAAFPLVQAPLQPAGSCQLVVHRSLNLAGNLSYFLEPTFCFRGADREFDYVTGRPFLRLRLGLANASLLPEIRRTLDRAGTVDFMELWSLQVTPRARLSGLEAGAFKASFDRSEAELRVYCSTGDACWKLHTHLQDNNTVMLENFNLEMTASLPSYDCWMPRPMRKQIGSPNSTYFDLSYLNSKTHQLPGCPKELPIALFAQKVVAGCPTFVYKREDSKAGFYVEPQFCFNGQVQFGYSYMTGSHYVSFGVDLNRPSVLTSVAAQLADLAPKRVAFLEVRKVNLSLDLGSWRPDYLLDGFFVTVDRARGAFRILCASRAACRELGSNVAARPWILFERIRLESLMANGIDCELSTSTHQQSSSAVAGLGGFHLPLDLLRLKLPTVLECKSAEAPRLFQLLTVDGCPVVVYSLPPPEKTVGSYSGPQLLQPEQRDLLIEPLLCFHGNAANATVMSRDYLTGEDFVSIQLMLQSHSVLKAVQEQLSLAPGSSSLRFAGLWDLRVAEEAEFDSLRVTRVGVSADQLTAELRVACRRGMCEALVETLAEQPADYLNSIVLSVTSLVPTASCHFKAPITKRPVTIGYSRSRQCTFDSLPTTTVSPRISFQLWMSQSCSSAQWTTCTLGSDGTVAYFFSRDNADWSSARSTCRRLNGDLATIGSGSVNRHVFTSLIGDTWIGMYKSGHQFVWVESGRDTGYRNFRSDHRSSGYDWQYGCVAMGSYSRYPYNASGQWEKKPCHNSLRFVCQFRMRIIG